MSDNVTVAADETAPEYLSGPGKEALDLRAARADVPGEVSAIDFHALISGPLTGLVDAQIASSMATTDFVINTCFKSIEASEDSKGRISDTVGEPVLISFKYPHLTEFGISGTRTLEVPLITMVPIPMLRIDNASIDFNCKITDVYSYHRATINHYKSSKMLFGGGTNPEEGESEGTITNDGAANDPVQDKFENIVAMQASISAKKSTRDGFEVKREYTMRIRIQAVQDDLPAGLDRLIGILEQQMLAKPAMSDLQTQALKNMPSTELK